MVTWSRALLVERLSVCFPTPNRERVRSPYKEFLTKDTSRKRRANVLFRMSHATKMWCTFHLRDAHIQSRTFQSVTKLFDIFNLIRNVRTAVNKVNWGFDVLQVASRMGFAVDEELDGCRMESLQLFAWGAFDRKWESILKKPVDCSESVKLAFLNDDSARTQRQCYFVRRWILAEGSQISHQEAHGDRLDSGNCRPSSQRFPDDRPQRLSAKNTKKNPL